MNENKIKYKNLKKPYHIYILFNKRVTELIGSKMKIEFLKNFNFKS